MDYMSTLPYEILFKILLEVPRHNTVLKICATNSVINQICNDDYFWQKRYEKYYPKLSGTQPQVGSTYKQLYLNVSAMGIAHNLRSPPQIENKISLHFIRPEPPYVLANLTKLPMTEIGGNHFTIIYPDIILKQTTPGIWSIHVYPRTISNIKRNILDNTPTGTLSNQDELIN